MARPEVPEVKTVTEAANQEFDLSASTDEVVVRARSSNVQAVAMNISQEAEDDPGGGGGDAMVLFHGEEIRFPVTLASQGDLKVKYIIFNDDTNLDDPVIEIVEIT